MLLGTITGILGGALQDGISYFKETKVKERDFKHAIELEKIRSENKVREFQAGITIAQEQTKQAHFNLHTEEQKTFGIRAQSEATIGVAQQETEKYWYDNLSKATQYLTANNLWANIANFFIATARPLITYCLGFLMFWVLFFLSFLSCFEVLGFWVFELFC